MLAAIPAGCLVIALDVTGKAWSTEGLAERLQHWMAGGRDVARLVGGPDGLATECLARSDMTWSLSALTFPHALVRIILAEQLYPQDLIVAYEEMDGDMTLRMQDDYDHSYHFVATFIGEHLAWHAEALRG